MYVFGVERVLSSFPCLVLSECFPPFPGRSIACHGDSDDDGLPNTYDYDDSFIDDDGMSSSTSSGDDNSDEDWQHPSDDGGGGEESEEDIKELAKEANEFVSNPKLHRR